MEKRLTVTNLAIFTKFINESIDKGNQVDIIFLDFQKAFDQMDFTRKIRSLWLFEQFAVTFYIVLI